MDGRMWMWVNRCSAGTTFSLPDLGCLSVFAGPDVSACQTGWLLVVVVVMVAVVVVVVVVMVVLK
ncbi:hypothetical protein E2C01_060163 [Portunus trituberculatus]|uniref:Transmembrane protein n=1 Tax=Portunus trituberculatus TaxID=210409 RepID=A0A5B7H1H8_PORTR|nr:hypothetical protein [Portunus trituberculatus]